jgi:predicted O-linked N-acetylglucosamine transferase (SPINDLY family)
LPPRSHGPITFGSFNTFAKVNEPLLKLWSQILLSVPNSRLFLKSPGLGSAIVCQEVRQRFVDWGIDPKRLDLRGREPGYKNHLALYGQMDIALDTFPYHGTTTTCEALWMGVPVISLAGSSHVSRVGVSLLSNIGLPELIAATAEEYIHLAVNLANDAHRLKELHGTLRQRMQKSPLMDAPEFARAMEAAYRQMWRTWCEAVHTAL